MKSTFNRDYKGEQISALSKLSVDNEYVRKIFDDAKQGRTFLAFRPNYKLSFYFQGRNMCDIDLCNDFDPTVETKYLPLIRSDEGVEGRITEEKWMEAIGTSKYTWGDIYSEIVDNLSMLSDREALQVSDLYRFSPLAGSDSKIVLLDIESKFSYPVENGITKPDLRIDVVLYNIKTRQLIFIEVKRLIDDRLQKKQILQAEIIKQLESYKELIRHEHDEIVREFNKNIEAYSAVAGIEMKPIDETKDVLLGLLITEYAAKDRTTVSSIAKKIEKITKVPVLSVGGVSSISTATLEDKWYSKLTKKIK